jgi:hypothetical protein
MTNSDLADDDYYLTAQSEKYHRFIIISSLQIKTMSIWKVNAGDEGLIIGKICNDLQRT